MRWILTNHTLRVVTVAHDADGIFAHLAVLAEQGWDLRDMHVTLKRTQEENA